MAGKTTIALLLAQAIDRPFVSLSALNTGVKELREVIADGGDLLTPVVFIDEIHRFVPKHNKMCFAECCQQKNHLKLARPLKIHHLK